MGTSRRIDTLAGAARHLGTTPHTVRRWITLGQLSPGPWTRSELNTIARTAAHPTFAHLSAHGTTTRRRAGCRCDDCNAAHAAECRSDRAARRDREWRAWGREDELCDLLANGIAFGDALEMVEIAAQTVTARRRAHPEFAERLDAALMTGRNPALQHGTSTAWRQGRCRCPECRAEHDSLRG